MTHFVASSSKGQMKIQQMAFMLVALVIFFALVALVYFTISIASLERAVTILEDAEARELVRSFHGSPEFTFTSAGDCSSCIDLDKVLFLKESEAYNNFWNLDLLVIEVIYPLDPNLADVECTRSNYPKCGKITLIEKPNFGARSEAFVTLARWDPEIDNFRYELGRIAVSGARANEE
jgi:hypothetical protein